MVALTSRTTHSITDPRKTKANSSKRKSFPQKPLRCSTSLPPMWTRLHLCDLNQHTPPSSSNSNSPSMTHSIPLNVSHLQPALAVVGNCPTHSTVALQPPLAPPASCRTQGVAQSMAQKATWVNPCTQKQMRLNLTMGWCTLSSIIVAHKPHNKTPPPLLHPTPAVSHRTPPLLHSLTSTTTQCTLRLGQARGVRNTCTLNSPTLITTTVLPTNTLVLPFSTYLLHHPPKRT